MRSGLAYVNLHVMSNPSRTFQLIETKLDRPLAEHVRALRQGGSSWHSVSLALAAETGVAVTPETIRIWLSNEPGMERGRASA